MNVLVINCGSSSLKYQLINSDTEDVLAKGLCERIGIDGRLVYQKAGLDKEITECAMPTHKEAIQFVLDALTNEKTGAIKSLKEVDAIGHRVVHGGEKFAASAVITDVKTGDVLACVSYPGYDNNRLVNNMDTDYYAKLSTDKSSPFFNKATQQTAAPGSTFKILSTIAGMSEGVIDDGTYINCTGSFDLVTPPINCWNKQGHGEIEIREAIEQSCNYYFNMVGFKLGQDADGNFSENRSLSVLQKYASEIGLDKKTGIEITETAPHVSDSYAVPSYIGQGTNAYTTSQLARYATAIATSGNVYDLTLLDRQTDSKGNTLKKYEPDIINTVDVSQNVWDDIHDGMYRVVQTHRQFDGLGVDVAGKTGTAEVNIYHPNHGMFVGYAPASDPEYAIAVRIENGYTSGNACLAADDIFKYIFELTDEKSILTGVAASDTSDTSND